MISFTHHGDFKATKKFMKNAMDANWRRTLERYGQKGVDALSSATPLDSGETAASWGYEIEKGHNRAAIYWTNSNENNGVNIAVILQYGHGTRTGGWVEGRDYINPAIRPIFDEIADAVWKEVTEA